MSTITNNSEEPKRPLLWLLFAIAMFIITVLTIPETIKYGAVECVFWIVICLMIMIFSFIMFLNDYND